MEKLFQIKSTFSKFISKQPVSLVVFQNPPLKSPCRSPLHVSIIPKEARRKQHKSGSFIAKEPTSPKVSCMGQVQCKKKKRKTKKHKRDQQPPVENNDFVLRCPEKKFMLWISKESGEGKKQDGKALVLEEKGLDTMKVPTLDMMKKFTSGRGSLYDFDATLAER